MKRILLLAIIPLIITIIWFRNGMITGGGEEGILFYSSAKTLQLSTSVWLEHTTGYSTTSWLSRSPVIYLAVAFDKVGIPAFMFQLLTFYILMIIGMISIYYLILNLLCEYKSKNKVALISALFYLLNPFAMSQIWGRGLHPQFFSFALLPLSLLLFILGIKRKKYFYAILNALLSALFATAYGFITFIMVYWAVLMIYLLYAIFTAGDKLKVALFGLRFTSLTFILWFFINLWWLIPFLYLATNTYALGLSGGEENLGTLMGVSQHFTPDLIIRLLQQTYFFSENSYGKIYSSFIFQLISLIPLIIVTYGFISLVKNKEFKDYKFFLILLVLGLLVSLGANPPLGWLFVWVFKHITVLQAFRNPFEKFGLVYVLGYAAIFALGLVTISERFAKAYFIRNIGVVLILTLVCGIYLWPMWTGRVISGQDGKVGIEVPKYYGDLNKQLNRLNKDDYRTFMTPLMSGDGAVFQWGDRRYYGVDPMVFIFDQTMISNSPRIPFYYDFTQSIRKYMTRMNVIPIFSLLRTKYLVARNDAALISSSEKEHEKYLTYAIDTPLGIEKAGNPICRSSESQATLVNPAWIVCEVPNEQINWEKVKYLNVILKTDVPSTIEIAVRDIEGARPRWDGRADSEYSTSTSGWTNLTIPLGSPTEYNNRVNFSQIKLVEILAHPLASPKLSTDRIELKGVWLDYGKQEKIDEFRPIGQFGKLNLYEPLNFNPVSEYGMLTSLQPVETFLELFKVAADKRDRLNTHGLILASQNGSKNTKILSTNSQATISDKSKISETRYWLKSENGQDGYLILSKTFDPGWKIVQNVSAGEIKGGFINDIKLLKKTFETEDNHFVVNGYANLWRIHIQSGELGIIYLPEIVADVSSKVSLFSGLTILGIGVFLIIKRKFLT